MASTQLPSWTKDFEVVTTDEVEEVKKNAEFEKLLDSSAVKQFEEGELFNGKVVAISDDFVTVDIGYKQEGLVFAKEFRNYDGSLKIKVGDEIEVYLEKLESHLGNLVLSKDKAEILKAWDKISEACEKGDPVKGTVIAKVKGGLSVDIGVKAFLPGSQIDIRPTKNLDKFIGKTMEFKVIKFNKKRGNIVLSRRAILQEERGKLRDETLGQISRGMIVKGIVKNITDYGAFIDLGGVDGLLHITDMSWGRVKHPSNILNVGDEIDVKILKYDSLKKEFLLVLSKFNQILGKKLLRSTLQELKLKVKSFQLKITEFSLSLMMESKVLFTYLKFLGQQTKVLLEDLKLVKQLKLRFLKLMLKTKESLLELSNYWLIHGMRSKLNTQLVKKLKVQLKLS
jgi:small subunit ribosomal protein S1